MLRVPRVLAAAALGLVLAPVGPRPVAQSAAPDVILITLDTVRADRIGAYGYANAATPTLDRMARDGVRFADASSPAPLTGPAHAAILTGRYPARLGVRDNASTPIPREARTLARAFGERGYRTGGFVGAFILGAEYGFAQGFDVFDATFARFSAGSKLQARRTGGEVVDRAIAWLRGGNGRPTFAWIHLYDAHAPYEPPAPFRARFAASPYDGAIAYVDSCLERIVSALEQSGRMDRAVISIVADHGEGLGDHGEAEHGMFLYEAVLHVPWILRLPAREAAGTVVATQVRSIDVAPTLAAVAGVALPDADGEDVLPLVRGTSRREPPPSYAETYYPKWHFGWSELRSIRVGDWKYIDAPRPELYDMRADAREARNLVDARGPLAAGLSAELGRMAGGFGAAAAEPPRPDPETLARLRSLGYIGIAASAPGVRGPDPKDMLPKLEMFRHGISAAMGALDRRAPDAAIAELKKLVAINDRSYELHLFLGDAYAAKREYATALAEYDAAAVLNPATGAPYVSQARVYVATGELRRAEQAIDRASTIEPGSSEAVLVRGSILEKQGRLADALAQYDESVRINGSDAQARASLASLAMRLGDYGAAKTQFAALLAMKYRPSRMHFGLAQVAEAQGDVTQAVAEYRLALRAEPGLGEARTALARLGAAPP